jgi:hypothetical protein
LADEKAMITKAGYLRHIGYAALDEEGTPQEIIELHIHGTKYGIRLEELRLALEGRYSARIERVFQNWQQYLGGIAGLAQASQSGKALNIEMIEGGRFTIPIDAVFTALSRKRFYAPVGELPEPVSGWTGRGRRLAEGQQRIPVGVL